MIELDQQRAGAERYAQLMAAEGMESLSGPGSTLANTVAIRRWIAHWIDELKIRSIVDLPCGDHHWMSQLDLPGVDYLGLDLAEEPLRIAQTNRPDRTFRRHNAIIDRCPRADLILCRDLLVHLTLADGVRVMEQFMASGSRYLMSTCFPGITRNEELREWRNLHGFGWRKLNIALPPFLPRLPCYDGVSEDEGEGKSLCLFGLRRFPF